MATERAHRAAQGRVLGASVEAFPIERERRSELAVSFGRRQCVFEPIDSGISVGAIDGHAVLNGGGSARRALTDIVVWHAFVLFSNRWIGRVESIGFAELCRDNGGQCQCSIKPLAVQLPVSLCRLFAVTDENDSFAQWRCRLGRARAGRNNGECERENRRRNRRRGVCAVFGLTVHRHRRADIPGIRINSHAGEGRLLGD